MNELCVPVGSEIGYVTEVREASGRRVRRARRMASPLRIVRDPCGGKWPEAELELRDGRDLPVVVARNASAVGKTETLRHLVHAEMDRRGLDAG